MRIYRPQRSRNPLPVVMYFHGGWVLGSKNTHDRLVRDLTNATNATNAAFVFVSYTPSPEAQFAPDTIATTEQLAGLPPALIIVDKNDVLRDVLRPPSLALATDSASNRSPKPM